VGALGVVVGAISRCELVVGRLSGGMVRSPTVLRSIWHRRGVSMEVILSMCFRDDCLFRLDLRSRTGDCLRIGGELGVLAVHNVRSSGGEEGGLLDSVRVTY
jgi:hypothetical protein